MMNPPSHSQTASRTYPDGQEFACEFALTPSLSSKERGSKVTVLGSSFVTQVTAAPADFACEADDVRREPTCTRGGGVLPLLGERDGVRASLGQGGSAPISVGELS